MPVIPITFESLGLSDLDFGTVAEGCPSAREVRVMMFLFRKHRLTSYLEVGCNAGRTVARMASQFPGGSFVGIDPGDQVPVAGRLQIQEGEYLSQDLIGFETAGLHNTFVHKMRFEDYTSYMLRGMVFIDGKHSYEAVRHDTAKALTLLSKPGVIVWHDYKNAPVPDATRAIDDIAEMLDVPVYHVLGTWTCFAEFASSTAS